MARAVGSFACCRRPTLRLPSIGRVLHKGPGNDCHNEIGDTQVSECAQDANALDEFRRDRRGNERAGPEPADRDAGYESSSIRKPLHQHGNRNDVSKTETDSADQSVTDVQPGKAICEAGEKNSQPIEGSAGQRNNARSFAVQPQATKERGTSKDKNANRKRQCYF